MPVTVVCPNCNRKFWSDQALCPSCGWDRKAEKPAAQKQEMVPGPGFAGLEELNVGQLRPMARDMGIKHWYRLDKAQLITAIKLK
jgi:hypothetical protein